MPEHSVVQARERRDYERTASIISAALTVVGSSDLAMRGLNAAVKRTAKSPQQNMVADWLKNYTAPGNPATRCSRTSVIFILIHVNALLPG